MARGPYAAIAVAIVAVSFSSIFIRWAASDAITIALYRLTFASLILIPFAAGDRSAPVQLVRKRDLALMAGIGVALAAHFAFWITSLKTEGVTVASSVVLVTSHPVFVAIVSHFAMGERVSAATAVGDVFAFLGGIMAGIYFLAGRRLRQRVSLPVYALVVYSTAAITLFVLAAAAGALLPTGALRRELVLFLAMAAIPQIGGHTLYNWSLRFVTAPVVSLSLVGEPIGASLLAWLLLAETPTTLAELGGFLALAGIFLTAYLSYFRMRG